MAAVGLLAPLQRSSTRSLEGQLEDRLAEAIRGGRLTAGVRLPSTRQVATALGVSRNVVAGAYAGLAANGLLIARHGAGTYVASPTAPIAARRGTGPPTARWLGAVEEEEETDEESGRIDLRARGGSLEPLSAAAWKRAWRLAIADLSTGYDDPRGDALLRGAVAGYAARNRGIACEKEEILITAGASDALGLLVRAVLDGTASMAVEEPGYQGIRQLAEAHGGRVLSLPIDADGAAVEQLPSGPNAPIAVHLTPAHQFPLGVELAEARRTRILDWAEQEGALIVENDYGGEFSFDGAAPPALAAIDRSGVVAYVGTFSRLLAPGLRIGYVVGPEPLIRHLAKLKREIDDYASTPTQRAVAHLLEDGELDRHLRRTRRLADYKRKRIAARLGGVEGIRVGGLQSGLHAVIEFPPASPPEHVATLARARGVLVETIASYRHGPPEQDRLVLDYSAVSPAQLESALDVLLETLDKASGRSSFVLKKPGSP